MEHKPIRCFEGNAKPYERFWVMRNEAETGGEPEMEFYGIISEYSWFEDDITPKMFKDDLYALGKGGPITLRIDSPGGELWAASTIRSILTTYPGHVTARVDGIAASAATLVALGANKVQMQDTATWMIHEPWIGIIGLLTIDILEALTKELKQARDSSVEVYTARTGISTERMKTMLHDETWLSAQQAVAMGFADEVLGAKPRDTAAHVAVMNSIAVQSLMKTFVNLPPGLLDISSDDQKPEDKSERERGLERLREKLKLYNKE